MMQQTQLTSRERVRKVLQKKIPDRVPYGLYEAFIGYTNDSIIRRCTEKTGEMPNAYFHHDIAGVILEDRPLSEDPDWLERVRNIRTVNDATNIMSEWIDIQRDINLLREEVAKVHSQGRAAMALTTVDDIETPFLFRGREQFFLDLGYEENWLYTFIDFITEACVQDAVTAARSGAEIFGIGYDMGSQKSLLISPEQWRRIFKPRLKRLIETVKKEDPSIKFFLHSDGYIYEIIPDLIEIGVDILNPIQPEVMDPAEIKKEFGKDLIFCGGISVQYTLPLGTSADIEQEVKLRMETIGKDGGYLMCPSHITGPEIPWENIEAYFSAAEKYGNYH